MKTSEDSFWQLLSLFLSSKVLTGFSIIPFDWQLPTFSRFSFLIPLHWPFPSSNTHPKTVAVTERTLSKAQAVGSWAIPPASWKLLKAGNCSVVQWCLPMLQQGKMLQIRMLLWKYRVIGKEAFAIRTKKLTTCQSTVLYKDQQIPPIQNGMHIWTVTLSMLWCLEQSSWVERI